MKNKNSQAKILPLSLASLILILGTITFFVMAQGASFDPEDNRLIGYELLDDGKVVHAWNTQDDYFFNKSSGIQFTNHFQDYWSKNIFCIGYYDGGEWNKIKCADELNNFNRNIETDNLTYVNATLWKDISYGKYDLRLGVKYHLGLDDKNLSITIYAKNIGRNIPFDLGFTWKITDLDIPDSDGKTQPYGDSIEINNTRYNLSGHYDLIFKNMSHVYTNFTINETTGEEIDNGEVIEYDSHLRFQDWTEFLRLDWDPNLDYAVKMYGDGNQESFYTVLLINAGHFNPGQEKSTTFQWIDAEGDFIESFDVAGGATGITIVGDFAWLQDSYTGGVTSKYFFPNFTDTGTGFSSQSYSFEIGNNETHLFYGGDVAEEIIWYTLAGVAIDSFGTIAQGINGNPRGPTTDGTSIWNINNDIFIDRYNMAGDYQDNFTIDYIAGGVVHDGTYIWVLENADLTVHKYWYNGTAAETWELDSDNAAPRGIAIAGGYFYVADHTDSKAYKYEGVPSAPSDTCTYVSGDHDYNCADYCNITSNVYAGGYTIVVSGTGYFRVAANITADRFAWTPTTCDIINPPDDGNEIRVVT